MPADINEHYDKIYRYCYYRVKNATLAEDLTQETFLRFFNQTSYLNRGKALAYLYTIARNLCIDTYKSELPSPLPDDNSESEVFAATETGYQKIESNLFVTKAVADLPGESAELVLLRIVNELSMKEISQITGLSRFTIRRKLEAALQQLKQSIRREDFYE